MAPTAAVCKIERRLTLVLSRSVIALPQNESDKTKKASTEQRKRRGAKTHNGDAFVLNEKWLTRRWISFF
jgi:hypothetical protein